MPNVAVTANPSPGEQPDAGPPVDELVAGLELLPCAAAVIRDNVLIAWNRQLTAVLDADGRDLADLLARPGTVVDQTGTVLTPTGPADQERQNRIVGYRGPDRDATVWLAVASHTIATADHIPIRIITCTDITDEQAATRNWESDAVTDPLTGLLNRRGLHHAIDQSPDTDAVVHFVDCDRFKSVNDSYGHSTGDFVLQVLAARLRRATRSRDLLARWGGDEFVVVSPGAAPNTGPSVASRFVEVVNGPVIDPHGNSVTLSVTVGTTSGPIAQIDKLVTAADLAMLEQKHLRATPHVSVDPLNAASAAVDRLRDLAARSKHAAVGERRAILDEIFDAANTAYAAIASCSSPAADSGPSPTSESLRLTIVPAPVPR